MNHCPHCDYIIYNRRLKNCENCEEQLPEELVFNEKQKQFLKNESLNRNKAHQRQIKRMDSIDIHKQTDGVF